MSKLIFQVCWFTKALSPFWIFFFFGNIVKLTFCFTFCCKEQFLFVFYKIFLVGLGTFPSVWHSLYF